MMNRQSNPAKIRAFAISEDLKKMMRPLFEKHMDDIISGHFSKMMMEDWANDDKNLLTWRAATAETDFEKTSATAEPIAEQTYFDHGTLLIAIAKAGVELAFEVMIASGIKAESAYYESLHELPLIANTIARKKLYEMNKTISDTAEYGCYLFDHACHPLIAEYIDNLEKNTAGFNFSTSNEVDNNDLIQVNKTITSHPIFDENSRALLSNGGRVYMLVTTADSVQKAQEVIYTQLKNQETTGLFYRTDIGSKAVKD